MSPRLARALPLVLALAGAVVLADVARRPAAPPAANPLLAALWDDGKAEFAIYRGTTPRYGEPRPTEMRVVVVKEDLHRESLVKSERGPLPGKTQEAIKLMSTADFQTGTYVYHQAASVFFDRASGGVLKETMSHHESCGITFVRVGPRRGRWVHEAHSYWEGEADREVALSWPPRARERLFWDGLPVSLRRWVQGGKEPFDIEVWVLPSQVSGHSPIESTRPVRSRLRMKDGGTIAVPAGRFRARLFELATGAGVDRFWFDESFPHPLLKMETAWGRKLSLQKLLRLDYWRHHANGDERILVTR